MTDITDLRLRHAFLEAAEKDFQEALSTALDVPSFSALYLRWEGSFLDHPVETARRTFRTGRQKALRMAACIALIAALSFAMLMATSAQAREWVLRWLMEWHPTHISFIATESSGSDDFKYWEPSLLPNGYEQSASEDLLDGFYFVYSNGDSNHDIHFWWLKKAEGSGFSLDNEWHIVTDIEVNGLPGKRFDATDGDQNMVLWFDEENQCSFLISGRVATDTLISVAESVRLRDYSPSSLVKPESIEIAGLTKIDNTQNRARW